MRSLIDYIGGLRIVGGDFDGQLFEVLPWERRFVRGAFATDDDAALSVARGNGKSFLCAGIASAVVDPDGPLTAPGRQVIVCAASFEQAAIIFRDVLGFLGGRHDLTGSDWRKQDSSNRCILEHKPTGALIRCIGSDPQTAHGLRPWLVLADEPAQWPSSTRDRMLAAIRTSLGKSADSRLIALGTRSSDPLHWFSVMLAGGCGYSQSHHARESDPPGHRRTWRKANPSLDHLPALEKRIRGEWQAAKRNPALLPSFRSLRLNLGVGDAAESLLIGADLWAEMEGIAELSGPCVWGIDTGGSAAMSAVAAYWPRTGALHCIAAFPSIPSLEERGVRDGVSGLYLTMAGRGELLCTGGRATDVPALLRIALERFGAPSAVVADRWKADDLRDALDTAGVPVSPFVERGMGYKDGAADVDAFRRACAEGKVTPTVSLLLRSAVSEARTVADPAGNEKLSKATEGGRRLRARDDAAAAAILAIAEGSRQPAESPALRVW